MLGAEALLPETRGQTKVKVMDFVLTVIISGDRQILVGIQVLYVLHVTLYLLNGDT